MAHIESYDEKVSFEGQIEASGSDPITMIGTYSFESAADIDLFLELWAPLAAFMRSQPGFISAQLHRATAGANVIVNYAVWESPAAYRAARAAENQSPLFEEARKHMPKGRQIRGVIVRKIALPGLCVA